MTEIAQLLSSRRFWYYFRNSYPPEIEDIASSSINNVLVYLWGGSIDSRYSLGYAQYYV